MHFRQACSATCKCQCGLAPGLLHQLHWLPVRQCITYKLVVLSFKIRHTVTPAYLSQFITVHLCAHTLCSSKVLLLSELFHKTTFLGRSFCCTSLTMWNSAALTKSQEFTLYHPLSSQVCKLLNCEWIYLSFCDVCIAAAGQCQNLVIVY